MQTRAVPSWTGLLPTPDPKSLSPDWGELVAGPGAAARAEQGPAHGPLGALRLVAVDSLAAGRERLDHPVDAPPALSVWTRVREGRQGAHGPVATLLGAGRW